MCHGCKEKNLHFFAIAFITLHKTVILFNRLEHKCVQLEEMSYEKKKKYRAYILEAVSAGYGKHFNKLIFVHNVHSSPAI